MDRPSSVVRGLAVAAVVMLGTRAPALAQPKITLFTPASGAAGTEVTVYGLNFDPRPFATGVAFNGTPAGAVAVQDTGASLTATVPSGATSGPITVTTGVGSASTAGLAHPDFQVSDVPVILGFFPASGESGQKVYLFGRSLRNTLAVTFTGGAVASPPFDVTVDGAGTAILARVPSGAATGPIAVGTPSGAGSTAALEPTPPDGRGDFVVGPPPVIDAFFPRSGPAATVLVISGRNLFGTTHVTLGGAAAPLASVDDTGTALRVVVPAGATTGLLAVETPRGTADTAGLPTPEFTVDAVPRIDGVYPPSGDVGTVVTILGANFGRDRILIPPLPSENVVRHGGVPWTVEAVSDDRSSLTARVAAGSSGAAPIQVTTPGGTAFSPAAFVVSNVPVLHGFQPTSGVAGVAITILGRNLGRVTQVTFNGVPALAVPGADGTTVRATVPADATTGPIAVTSGGGTASTGDLVPPKLFVVSPSTPCGNGVVDFGETCDDGNLEAGDCCSPLCQLDAAGAACAGDGNPCTQDACDGAGACLHAARTGPCDDGVFCNGADACEDGECRLHAGDPCAGGGECDAACDEAAGSCAAPAGAGCTDDGDLCTVDACDGAGTCTHVAEPQPACKQPARRGAARIRLARRPAAVNDRLEWTFAHGDATSRAELGDPLTATAYALCIFDGTGALLVSAQLPPGGTCAGRPCWTAKRGRIHYGDPTLGTTGVSEVAVKPGKAGRTTARVSGRGAALGLPPTPLADLPLTVQLLNGAGTCWGSVFSRPARNAAERFQAKSDKPRSRATRARPGGGSRP
jgi:cysteine-rich repeat protein